MNFRGEEKIISGNEITENKQQNSKEEFIPSIPNLKLLTPNFPTPKKSLGFFNVVKAALNDHKNVESIKNLPSDEIHHFSDELKKNIFMFFFEFFFFQETFTRFCYVWIKRGGRRYFKIKE